AARPTVARPAPRGRPAIAAQAEEGFWIWRTDNGQWHLRTTSPGKLRHFAGAISVKGAKIKSANSVRPEAGDKIQLNAGKIDFLVATQSGIDGLDFLPSDVDTCVLFDLTMDAEQVPDKIMVGHQEAHPLSARFTSCP